MRMSISELTPGQSPAVVLADAVAAVEAGAVAEADARDLAKDQLRYGSTGDWLTHIGGLHRGEGKQRVVRARALTGPLGRTMRGLLDGTVSPGQADLIVRAVADLPSGAWVRRRGEKVLLRQAGHLDATDLAKAGPAPGRGGRPRHHRPPARGRPRA